MSDHDHAGAGEFPGELWQAADLVTPMAIRVAATLRLADHIAAGTNDAVGLAAVVDADADAMGRLLEHLVTAGIVERVGNGGYVLTDFGAQLTDTHLRRGRAWLDSSGAVGRADLSLVDLAETIRTGQPAYPRVYGRGFWEDLAVHPELSASFDEVMVTDGFRDVVAAYDWSAASHVIDVGGGNGTLLAAIVGANPDLHGTVVELQDRAQAAVRTLADAALADRTRVVEGSFFDALPDHGDHYVLSAVIHDWDDHEATTILRRCAEAAGPEGTVVLVEGLRTAADGAHISTEMDLRMLAYFAGRERTLDQLEALARGAGLEIIGVHPAGEHRSLIVLRTFKS